MADTVSEAIEENAKGPKKISVTDKGETVEQHDIEQQIKGAHHAAAEEAATKNHFGFRFGSLKFPGMQ